MSRTQKLAAVALLAATAYALGYVESLIVLPTTIPGVKLGLGNICVLLALYLIDARAACAVMLLKVALSGLLFGSPATLLYSAAGALLAFGGMWLLKAWGALNVVAVSVVAAVLHNLAQVLTAVVLLQTPAIALNLPMLTIIACITGIATGTVASRVISALRIHQATATRKEGSKGTKRRSRCERYPDKTRKEFL
ncbi:MAG: Gx transporter family protein [Coriobacteriales bacterium]|jgi:heptaprenyl diphosphate synthase|nr:Gx transporter family protein [Coriobacteriales bacterium]